MKTWKWKEIIELVGTIAILFGIFFVYEELKQNGTIARAELSAETARGFASIVEQVRDTEFAKVLAKSIDSPAELTHAERLQMNAFLNGVLHHFGRELYYYNRGFFGEWTSTIRRYAPMYFSSSYGQAYWGIEKNDFGPKFVAAVDEALANHKRAQHFQTFDAKLTKILTQE